MNILKLSAGLDPGNMLQAVLGPGFNVVSYDSATPVRDQVRDMDVLLLRDIGVSAELIDAAPKLRLLQRYGQHLMNIDVAHALRKGIYVARIPAEVSRAYEMVAEHAFCLMIGLAKYLPDAARSVSSRLVGVPQTVALSGKKLGLIGLGHTGTVLARLARGFGMEVMAVKRTIEAGLADTLGLSFLGTIGEMERLLREADFISIHLPLGPDTRGFIGTREFGVMKRGAFLVNIARAEIVEKQALSDALTDGRLAGVGLDVFWEEPADPRDPLLKLPNVLLTPHIAGGSRETYERLARAAAENIVAVAEGRAPKYQITAAPPTEA